MQISGRSIACVVAFIFSAWWPRFSFLVSAPRCGGSGCGANHGGGRKVNVKKSLQNRAKMAKLRKIS